MKALPNAIQVLTAVTKVRYLADGVAGRLNFDEVTIDEALIFTSLFRSYADLVEAVSYLRQVMHTVDPDDKIGKLMREGAERSEQVNSEQLVAALRKMFGTVQP